jgi:hypothetical protein
MVLVSFAINASSSILARNIWPALRLMDAIKLRLADILCDAVLSDRVRFQVTSCLLPSRLSLIGRAGSKCCGEPRPYRSRHERRDACLRW